MNIAQARRVLAKGGTLNEAAMAGQVKAAELDLILWRELGAPKVSERSQRVSA